MNSRKKVLWKIFISTLYLSAFTFGGGYVIVSFMKKKFVDELHWIEEKEMLDLVAIVFTEGVRPYQENDSNYKEAYALENVDFSKSLSGLKVLLVEDNELNMEIAKFILENAELESITMRKEVRD